MIQKLKDVISPFAFLSTVLFFIIAIIHSATEYSRKFADFINGSISHGFRMALASVGEIFPFSLFEILILCLPIIISLVIYRAVRVFPDKIKRARFIINLFAIVLLVYSGHLLALGVGHNTTPIDKKMEIFEVEVTKERLEETMADLIFEINSLADSVPRDARGVYISKYSFEELSSMYSASYIDFASAYGLPRGYYSTAKAVLFSDAFSYLNIGGIYTYVTGEANVNTNPPDYVTTFTIAHELCHQRGIMRENEASFIAYILTSTSEDAGVRYSGALNMYSYFASALYKTDKDSYYRLVATLSETAKVDIRAANEVYYRFSDTIFQEISDYINDFYLTSSGSGGIVSYSRVVHLVLAYKYGEN